MSDQENFDIGKIVGIIMENPQLIEQISNLARQNGNSPATAQEEQSLQEKAEPQEKTATASAEPTYSAHNTARGNRAQLLGALKPYVSGERAKAIDSMISIADIIDMMRSR